jgi:hypothetical protein
MCSMHIDEPSIHVSIATWSPHLCVLFSEKLDSLFDRLDNRCTMHGSRNESLECWCENQNGTHYCSHATLHNYKYTFQLARMTILHSSFSHLGFPFLALDLLAMEDKRGTKSHSAEGSMSPSDAKTSLSVPSESPSPPGSPREISSCRPHTPVFEQGDPSGNIPVIDLSSSSDVEDLLADTSRDAEFTRQLFGDLNRDVLGPPGDSKVIILSDSDEKEEVHEETAIDANATPSVAEKSLTIATSAADDEDPGKMQDGNSDDLAPERDMGKGSGGGDEAGSP